MRATQWKRLPEIKEENEMDELDINDYFLYGNNVIAQKQNKKEGQEITYYVVVDKPKRGSVVYAPIFDILEKDIIIKGEEK